MSPNPPKTILNGSIGQCGSQKVFLGFAPSNVLCSVSSADILDEGTGKGYQRRFNEKHSLDFRKYIQKNKSTTIPLTFNLRPKNNGAWHLKTLSNKNAQLIIKPETKVLFQVDCQHRLGYLADLAVPLAFMVYIGLSAKEEMQIFNVINSKAKGLSTSLLDFHESQLVEDLGKVKPELLLAMQLNEDKESPWYKQLDLGGNRTSGMNRRASLRTMQKAIKRFLQVTNATNNNSIEDIFSIILGFWCAVTEVLETQWLNYRKHFLTKGIGVYSLMGLAGDLYLEAQTKGIQCTVQYFSGVLSDFIGNFDWSTNGPLKGLGGEAGAKEALYILRELRSKSHLKAI